MAGRQAEAEKAHDENISKPPKYQWHACDSMVPIARLQRPISCRFKCGTLGVTRRSVLELAQEWQTLEGGVGLEVSERRLKMAEVVKASEEGRVRERTRCGIIGGNDLTAYANDRHLSW